MLRNFFLYLSQSEGWRRFITGFGPTRTMARRFVAGETLDEAVAVVKALNSRGILATMNHLGEHVASREDAYRAGREYQELLHRIAAERLQSTISVKPSHLGLNFGADFFYENVADVVQVAHALGNMVEVDMEESASVQANLDVYHRLLDTFQGPLRLAIQSYLYRSGNDVQTLIERGTSIRLVKGAYQEPATIAFQKKAEVDAEFIKLMELYFGPRARETGAYLAVASHDPRIISRTIAEARSRGIGQDAFEFQMLQGVRRDEQQRLADAGYRMRVFVPYGREWYPYFMRRLAERPANVLFAMRAIFGK
ncbi:MAG: proline dehydrogenase family protein [Anaerolineae bacterium]